MGLFQIEWNKLIAEFKTYKVNHIVDWFDTVLVCVGIFMGTAQDMFPMGSMLYALLGMILWRCTTVCLQTSCNILQTEIRIGTLEQLLLAKYSLHNILFIRIMTELLLELAKLAVASFAIIAVFDIRLEASVNPLVFFVALLLCMCGIIGISYMTASLTLIYKKANAVVNALNYFTLFFTGLLISLDELPHVFSYIACCLPFYWSMELIKNMRFDGGCLQLALVSLLWMAVGVLCLRAAILTVLRRGTTSRY